MSRIVAIPHVAFDPEHRLVIAVVPGARDVESTEALVGAFRRRTGDRTMRLMTSDAYRFSKDWRYHEAATYFSLSSDNFCWPVRTLREPIGEGHWRRRNPAMAAGLTDHVWSMAEWISFQVVLRS